MRSCLIVVLAGTGIFILVACAEPPERGPEVPVAFTMKDVSTANTTVSSLPDGRVQIRVEHDLIRGVTPEMLMWFYENVPTAKVEVGGRLYPLYHIWHPGDHVSVAVITPAPSGSPGLSAGATIHVKEFVGDGLLDQTATMERRDAGGTRLVGSLGPLEIMRLEHSFRATDDGVLVISTGTVGSTVPIIGSLLNLAARRMITEDRMRPMFRHMIEEFGNFEFFLRQIWVQRQDSTLRLPARPDRTPTAG
jgi:hypothetical protein